MDHELIAETPVPVWFTEWEPEPTFESAPEAATAHWLGLYKKHRRIEFRATNLSRLPVVLATGVDVEPSTHHIYAADFEKAWEYGKFPKVIAAYRADRLDRTFRTLPLDPALDERSERRQRPYEYRYEWADTRFISQIRHTTPGGPGYEWEYGYWIPGDAREALVGLFTYGSVDDLGTIRGLLREYAIDPARRLA